MIYQSGYLTIKDYDSEFGTFLLDFPNNEVKKGFVALIASDYLSPHQRQLYRIGASFSSQTGTIDDWKLESRPNA